MKYSYNILSSSIKPWAIQASGQPFVYFEYNPVGDNTRVYSSVANDWERLYTYDRLGRRESYAEGNLHETYIYDGGNLAELVQEWFENGQPQSKTTRYHYNAHRLDSVSYEDALTTIYHYDQYGRVDSLYDESGVMCYEYGNMGEVTRETRIYALSFLTTPVALSTQFRYDSWGRVDSIYYPDGERLNYQYDLGGQLQSITNNSSYTYLDNVAYDRFGAKVSQTYGNGLVTGYAYDNTTRRLSQITVTDNGNNPYSDIQYTYDPVGNVTQVASNYSWLNNQSLTETFTYDASDQLVSAAETQAQCYQLEVGYGDWGRITDYALSQTDMMDNSFTSDAYSFCYPTDLSVQQGCQTLFAPEMQTGTTDVAFTFGINGSLRRREVSNPQPYTEYYLFNSAANLKAYSYDGLDFAYYGYNAANTRTYKLSMINMNQWVNGEPEPVHLQPQQAMFYPNAYINFNQNGEYTKHYYNGSERIASRLGDMTAYIYADAGERLENRIMRLDALFREELGGMLAYEEPEQPAILGNRNGGTRELVSPPVEYEPFLSVSSLQPTGTPDDIFYYHMNHLGSTAFVTDQSQNVTQGFLYAPFGEITTEYAPLWQNGTLPKYAFNAKELDEETGMYYYEARYYKPPVFTSRDPHFERYFTFSPYTYAFNNPSKFIDPTGKDGEVTVDEENKTINIKVNIILYTKTLGTAKLSQAAKAYKKEIMDKWGKDENGNPWTVQHKGESYTVNFDVNVSVDQKAWNEKHRDYNGVNNYIEVVSEGFRSNVNGDNRTGTWAIPTEDHNSASHEFGHLIGLKDRYSDNSDDSRGYRPHAGWENNIMAERNGVVEQRNINNIFYRPIPLKVPNLLYYFRPTIMGPFNLYYSFKLNFRTHE